MISAVCQGLLSCRRHIGKREDPGDEVGRRHIGKREDPGDEVVSLTEAAILLVSDGDRTKGTPADEVDFWHFRHSRPQSPSFLGHVAVTN